MQRTRSFSVKGLDFYFQSNRARIDGTVPARLVKFIQAAKHSLDVAIYDLKHPDVLKALKTMSGRVRLQILYDAGKGPAVGAASITVDPKSGTEQAIVAAGLKQFARPVAEKGGHLMHNKFIVRDGATVWSGSGNFTNGGLLLQDNNFFVMDSPALATAYSKAFGELSGPGHATTHLQGAHGAPTTVKLGSVTTTVLFSTQFAEAEGIETEVANRLKGARKVRVIAMLVSDKGILASLLALKNKDIKGVLDPHEMKQVMKSKPKDPTFWFAQGDPRFVAAPSHAFSPQDKNDFMHNKVMIIDDKVVIAGSYNFSENAEKNDENMVIFESPAVAAAYNTYFEALFAQYTKNGAKLPPV